MGEYKITTQHQARAGDVAAIVAQVLRMPNIALDGMLEGTPLKPVVLLRSQRTDSEPIAKVYYNGNPSISSRDIILGTGTEFTITGDAVTDEIYGRVKDIV